MATSLLPQEQRLASEFRNFLDLGLVQMGDIVELSDSETRSQHWRRNYIRASVALIEGFGHCLREMCAVGSECSTKSITPKERQVLHAENSFDTNERIKLTLRVAYRLFELEPEPVFTGHEWKQAQWALKKRHLLMHPKTPADMDIPDEHWKQIAASVDWLIKAHFDFWKLLRSRVPALQR